MRVIDRDQAKRVASFGSTTQVNARLLRLTRAGLLRRFFLGTKGGGQKAIYALSQAAAKLVDGEKINGEPVRTQDDAILFLSDARVGETLRIAVTRDGSSRNVELTLTRKGL